MPVGDSKNKSTITNVQKTERRWFVIATKQKLGLALGSGSAWGLAHVGVLQALEDEKIAIDCICGSSMGAVIGGIYAAGTDVDMLAKVIPTLDARKYFDMVNPKKGGLLRGQRFQELIRLFTKNRTFSETDIPFSCVAVDIENVELVILNAPTMRVDEAIRASMSIPGVFQPYTLDGRLLVDGGVLSRVPLTPLRSMDVDIVIGVDVGYRKDQNAKMAKPETLIDFVFAATDIMSWEMAKRDEENADVMIYPTVSDCDRNSFSDAQKAICAGYEAAMAAMPQIRKGLEKKKKKSSKKKIEKK